MDQIKLAKTEEPKGLYGLLFKRLGELKASSNTEIIPFQAVLKKLCSNFSMSKQQCWDILFMLRELEIVEIVPFKGIKINLE